MRKGLQNAFENKQWRGSAPGTRSGPGSTMAATARLRAALPGLFARYDVATFLDAPCGDWHWMQHVDLDGVNYIGGDISSQVVDDNEAAFARDGVSFRHLDISSDALPKADLMMVRDCLFHLRDRVRWAFLRNFIAADIPHLLLTMHHLNANKSLDRNGDYAAFSPLAAPFHFAEPLEIICETHDTLPEDMTKIEKPWLVRSLGVWSRDQIAEAVVRRDARLRADELKTEKHN